MRTALVFSSIHIVIQSRIILSMILNVVIESRIILKMINMIPTTTACGIQFLLLRRHCSRMC